LATPPSQTIPGLYRKSFPSQYFSAAPITGQKS